MTRLLQVGDRVIVVYPDPCCGNTNSIGLIFTIVEISKFTDGWEGYCRRCHATFDEALAWKDFAPDGKREGFLLETLQRIDPEIAPAKEREKEVVR